MSSGLTLPPLLNACDCFLIRVATTPWRRSSLLRACSLAATLRPLIFCPFLSMPSQLKATSFLSERIAEVACAMVNVLPNRSFDGHAVDFLETGQSVLDLLETGPAQIPYPFLRGLVRDVDGVAARHDDAAEFRGDFHDLVQAQAALVAVGAVAAAL